MWMPDPNVNADELAAVKGEYLRRYFKPPAAGTDQTNGHTPPTKRHRSAVRTEPLAGD